jgi:hypothetical protein
VIIEGDSRIFAEFVSRLEGRRPEVNTRHADNLRTLSSELGFEELLSALETFKALPRSTTNPVGAFTVLKRKPAT